MNDDTKKKRRNELTSSGEQAREDMIECDEICNGDEKTNRQRI